MDRPQLFPKCESRNGGQGRNRTADASLFRAALYRLSYLAAAQELQSNKSIRLIKR